MGQPTNALTKWMQGKKTYITAGAILVTGILQTYGVDVPPYVWAALAALGMGSLRASIPKKE